MCVCNVACPHHGRWLMYFFLPWTLQENLKRHTVLHSQSHADTSFPCDFCSTTFARQDLRWRHIKYKHPEVAAESVGPTSTRSRRTRPTRPARSSSTSTSPLTPTGQQSDPQAEFSSAYQLDSQAESSSTTGDFDMGIDGWDFALLGHTAGTDSVSIILFAWGVKADYRRGSVKGWSRQSALPE